MKKSLIKYACSVGGIIAIVMATQGQNIRSTERGLAIMGNAEGCVRVPYKCPADIWTYGIGTAESSGEKIQQGKIYTDKEIADSWAKHIKTAEQCVNRYANGDKLPQGAFEAATSIAFNVGCGKIKNSTLFNYAKSGNIKAMCEQFPRWIYSNGKVLDGLIDRRDKEKALCLAS